MEIKIPFKTDIGTVKLKYKKVLNVRIKNTDNSQHVFSRYFSVNKINKVDRRKIETKTTILFRGYVEFG